MCGGREILIFNSNFRNLRGLIWGRARSTGVRDRPDLSYGLWDNRERGIFSDIYEYDDFSPIDDADVEV